MNIHILCTDFRHPVNPWLERWMASNGGSHNIRIARHSSELDGGDFLFLISCHEIIRKPVRDMYRFTLVIHASALPRGRGMSPHLWQILEGKSEIPVTLLNAEDAIDSGDIWHQLVVRFSGHELHDEVNRSIFDAEVALMSWAIRFCDTAIPASQIGEASFYRRRTPEDSRLDPYRTIESQFELLRVADPGRYPAFFELRGKKYKLTITKMEG